MKTLVQYKYERRNKTLTVELLHRQYPVCKLLITFLYRCLMLLILNC